MVVVVVTRVVVVVGGLVVVRVVVAAVVVVVGFKVVVLMVPQMFGVIKSQTLAKVLGCNTYKYIEIVLNFIFIGEQAKLTS